MIGRITTIQVQPGKMDECVRAGNELIAVMSTVKGFRSNLILVDRNANKAVSIVLMETGADAQAWLADPRRKEVWAPMSAILVGPPIAEDYEVVGQA